MMLSQGHRAIWNLQHRREKYEYAGTIEVSPFTDKFGFRSYRIAVEVPIAEVRAPSAGFEPTGEKIKVATLF